ncbi:MAG: S1C family serine protease [Acidimicrobiales bacterium]
MDETYDPGKPLDAVPSAGAERAEPTPLPAPGAGSGAWEPLMPLSMPPFAPPAAASGGVGAGAVPPGGESTTGATPPGGAPPVAPWLPDESGWYGPTGPVPPAATPARNGRKAFTVAAAAALLAGGLGAGLGIAFSGGTSGSSTGANVPVIPTPTRSTVASSGPTESTGAIAKAVEPAIVDINTNVASPASQGQAQAAGTGMIITSSGEVLTNNHVVADATKITVSIQGHSGTYGATVIGVDPLKDVALLQIQGFSGALPTVRLGNSSTAAVGNPVVAMGNALGLGQQPTTVTGIVSALGRTITASDSSPTSVSETLHGLIETDAPIQPGDSGGPLLNGQGQVIGMDTAAASASGSGTGSTLGFAIPINEARAIVQQMERGKAGGGVVLGETAFLGVFDGTTSSVGGFGGFGFSQPTVSGVPVSDVAIGSPAQAAGISGGDTITAVDSVATPTVASLQKAIESKKPGDQVTVTYVDTTGTSHTATVTLIGMPK